MRVLHAINDIDPTKGGPVIALQGMIGAQIAAGIEASMIATWKQDSDRSMAESLRQQGVKVDLIGPVQGRLHRHPDLLATLESAIARCDVIHVHTVWEQIQHFSARIARHQSVPYVMTPHGMLTQWSLAQKRLKKQLYLAWRLRSDLNGATAIHYITETERNNLALAHIKAPELVIPIGVDLSEFQQLPPRGTMRQKYPQLGNRPLVVFMGRIHPGKGLEYLVPAFAQIECRTAMLMIIGPDSGGYRKTIEMMVRQHGLQERVVFTGMLKGTDRVAALSDADLFALPSDHENFGVVVIEALAAGLPVVISKHVPMHGEILAAGVGSVAGQGPVQLAQKLDCWLSNDHMRYQCATNARSYVWKHYDWTNIAQQWAQHYVRFTAGRTTR